MFEGIILGIIQGIAEWLPVSSEGLVVLVKANFFENIGLAEIIRFSLFLHLGTFLSALVYFSKDVLRLLKSLSDYKKTFGEDKVVLNFLITATIVSGVVGYALFVLLDGFADVSGNSTKLITIAVGIMLLVTAILQIKGRRGGVRVAGELNFSDGLFLGIVQGFSILPGLSRSGLTVGTLLLRKIDDAVSLKLSFLMSLPVVLAGNIVLNLGSLSLGMPEILGFLFSFLFGLVTIHILLRWARRVNFGYFVLFFGLLMILASII